MEDGCVGGFVQRGVAAAGEASSRWSRWAVPAPRSQPTRATEAAVRGFWTDLSRVYGAIDAMDAGPTTLFRLAALNSDYAACIDADRLEDWPEFFLDDCLYKITTADNHRRGYAAGVIYADSRAMLRDRVAALREANIYERQTYRHIVGMPRVVRAGAGTISAETPFLVVRTMRDGRMDMFAAGVLSRSRREDSDGALRFAERIVVCDSPRFDTLLAIPL